MENKANGNMPEKHFKYGGVRVSVWGENRSGRDGSNFKSWSVKLDRAYKDAGGEWKNTYSLKESDLPKAIAALQEAFKYIVQKGDTDDSE